MFVKTPYVHKEVFGTREGAHAEQSGEVLVSPCSCSAWLERLSKKDLPNLCANCRESVRHV